MLDVVGTGLSLFGVGRTLEETAALFDGEGQEEVLTQAGGDAAATTTRPMEVHVVTAYIGKYRKQARGGAV